MNPLITELIKIYLMGNFLFGILWLAAALVLSSGSVDDPLERIFVHTVRAIFAALLVAHLLVNLAIIFKNVPQRLPEHRIGDGVCDFTGETAAVGLFRVHQGIRYIGGQPVSSVYEYRVRSLENPQKDKLIAEYAQQAEWLAYLDRERAASDWLAKFGMLTSSVMFLIFGLFANRIKKYLASPAGIPPINPPVPLEKEKHPINSRDESES